MSFFLLGPEDRISQQASNYESDSNSVIDTAKHSQENIFPEQSDSEPEFLIHEQNNNERYAKEINDNDYGYGIEIPGLVSDPKHQIYLMQYKRLVLKSIKKKREIRAISPNGKCFSIFLEILLKI